MKTVTLSVSSRDDVTRRARAAFKGKKQGAHISFSSIELLWQTLTKKRWEVLKAMTGQDAMTLREVARRVGRDVKGSIATCMRSSMPACSIAPMTAAFIFPTVRYASISLCTKR
jgi:predicted transcriptional regulator